MSTTRLNRQLAAVTENSTEPVLIKLNITTALHKKLLKLNHIDIYADTTNVTINHLSATISQINRALKKTSLSNSKRLLLEEYKLAILQSILSYLNTFNRSNHLATDSNETKKKSRGILGWLKTGFIFLISLIGLAESSVGSFLGMRNLLSLIAPNIGNFWLMAATLGVTAINFVLFIAFEVDMLKSLFNIGSRSTAKKIIETHQKQINEIASLNQKLTDIYLINNVTQHQYQQLVTMTTKFNRDARLKHQTYQEYREHPFKKTARLALTVLGAGICGLGSYWGGSVALAAIAAPLVGTPIGWCIIGGLVLSNLVFYFAMQGTGIKNLFNPCMNAFNSMKETLKKFSPHTENDLCRIKLANRNAFKSQHRSILAGDLARPSLREDHKDDLFFTERKRMVDALTDSYQPRYRPGV